MNTAVKIDFAMLGTEVSEEMLPITKEDPEWYKTNALSRIICKILRKYCLDDRNQDLKEKVRNAFLKDMKKRQRKKCSGSVLHTPDRSKKRHVFGVSREQVAAEARAMAGQRGEDPDDPLYK